MKFNVGDVVEDSKGTIYTIVEVNEYSIYGECSNVMYDITNKDLTPVRRRCMVEAVNLLFKLCSDQSELRNEYSAVEWTQLRVTIKHISQLIDNIDTLR